MPSREHCEATGETGLSCTRQAPHVRSLAGLLSFSALFWARGGPLLAAGLVLPNILSLATLCSLIDVGLPPRTGCILLYAALAICARRLPTAISAILFLAVLAFDLVWTLSLMFGLAPTELLVALDHARRIHFFASPLYLGLIAVLAVTSLMTVYLLSGRESLARGNVYVLFSTALLFGALDYYANTSAHFQFGSRFGRGQALVTPASIASDFNTVAGVNGRNVVVVIVESLGYLTDPTARAQVAAPLFDTRVTQKYKVTSGHSGYFGSTTAGEMRELCQTREGYRDFTAKSGASCLPERLRQRGYATIAVHSFSGDMFERKEWYPKSASTRKCSAKTWWRAPSASAAARSAACATPIFRR